MTDQTTAPVEPWMTAAAREIWPHDMGTTPLKTGDALRTSIVSVIAEAYAARSQGVAPQMMIRHEQYRTPLEKPHQCCPDCRGAGCIPVMAEAAPAPEGQSDDERTSRALDVVERDFGPAPDPEGATKSLEPYHNTPHDLHYVASLRPGEGKK